MIDRRHHPKSPRFTGSTRPRPAPPAVVCERLEGRTLLAAAPVDGDDQLREAASLAPAAPRTATLSPGTDVDLFKFTAAAGQRLGFDLDRPSGGTLDSYLRVFDAGGKALAANDNANAPGETAPVPKESYVEYTFAKAGTYYVGVSGSANRAYNPVTGGGDVAASTGGFTLRMNKVPPAPPADGDDQIAEAAATAVGGAPGGTLSPAADVDLFKFTAAAGQRVGIDLDRAAGSTLDSYLRLFDAGGTPLAWNDDANAPGEAAAGPKESYLDFMFAAAGTYYVGVSGSGNAGYNPVTGGGDAAGSTGGYILRLNDIPPAPPPVVEDEDDQISEARTVTIGEPFLVFAISTLDTGDDVNLYQFTVAAGHKVNFDVEGYHGTAFNSYLRVFDGGGRQLAPSPGANPAYVSHLEFTFAAAGTYYVGVSHARNAAYDPVTGGGDADRGFERGVTYDLVAYEDDAAGL